MSFVKKASTGPWKVLACGLRRTCFCQQIFLKEDFFGFFFLCALFHTASVAALNDLNCNIHTMKLYRLFYHKNLGLNLDQYDA
jgi:hypothetical protein